MPELHGGADRHPTANAHAVVMQLQSVVSAWAPGFLYLLALLPSHPAAEALMAEAGIPLPAQVRRGGLQDRDARENSVSVLPKENCTRVLECIASLPFRIAGGNKVIPVKQWGDSRFDTFEVQEAHRPERLLDETHGMVRGPEQHADHRRSTPPLCMALCAKPSKCCDGSRPP